MTHLPSPGVHRPDRASSAAGIRHAAVALILGLVLASLVALPAFAHSELVSSDPADRAVLAVPPTTVTLTFSEQLAPKSTFKLIDAGGTVGNGTVGADGVTLVLDGLALAAGDYEIQWTSIATDGDILRGVLTFTVADATPAPSVAASSVAAPSVAAPSASAPSASAPAGTSGATPPSSASPAAATPVPSAAPTTPVSSTSGDVLLPTIAALVIVAGVGAYLFRRSRAA